MSGLPRLTDWIDDRIKPTIPGVYQRKFIDSPEFFAWALYDGREWMLGHCSFRGKDCAYEDSARAIAHAAAETYPSFSSALPWRGLAEPPQ